MLSLIGLVAFIAIIYFAIKLFKQRKVKVKNQADGSLKKKYKIGLFASIIIFLIAGIASEANDSTETSSQKGAAPSAKVVKKTKHVGKDKYGIAKQENVALVSKKDKLSKQEKKLQKQKDQIIDDEFQAKQKAKEEQEAAQKQQEQQAKEAQKQQAAAQKQQEEQAKEAQQQASSASSSQSRGDMNTGDTGTIVGNSQSHIYHVPGQRGYNMNSSNAVYFNNEQDAINAGYRRSKV